MDPFGYYRILIFNIPLWSQAATTTIIWQGSRVPATLSHQNRRSFWLETCRMGWEQLISGIGVHRFTQGQGASRLERLGAQLVLGLFFVGWTFSAESQEALYRKFKPEINVCRFKNPDTSHIRTHPLQTHQIERSRSCVLFHNTREWIHHTWCMSSELQHANGIHITYVYNIYIYICCLNMCNAVPAPML